LLQIWFEEATTDVTGTIRGHGANGGKPLLAGKMRSVVLFEYNAANNVTLADDPQWYIKNGGCLVCWLVCLSQMLHLCNQCM
jgi:type IV secretory pathway TrbD component